jgi:hypothetical protein
MANDGVYKYYRNEKNPPECLGTFKIENGNLSIVDDPNKILHHMFTEGPVDNKVGDIIKSVNRNHYASIKKDDSSQAVIDTDQFHDPKAIDKDNKATDFTKLEHLKAILEKEEECEEISIPEHIVLQAGSHHWDD